MGGLCGTVDICEGLGICVPVVEIFSLEGSTPCSCSSGIVSGLLGGLPGVWTTSAP